MSLGSVNYSVPDSRSKKAIKLSLASASLLFTLMIVLPQSYFIVKLFALVVYLISHGFMLLCSPPMRIKVSDAVFYSATSIIGLIWVVVGSLNGNAMGGILDGLKLYFAWSILFLVILTMRRNVGDFRGLHQVFLVSTFLICAVNLARVVDLWQGFDFFPDSFTEELGLQVQFYEGFTKIHSNNIASLLFLVPYLMTCWFLKCNSDNSRLWTSVGLLFGLVITIMSGRRALWILLAMEPAIIYFVALFSGHASKLRFRASTIIIAYGILFIFAAGAIQAIAIDEFSPIDYALSAFSDEDERSIQKIFLFNGFYNFPFFGSGFGGCAGYTRSVESPWLYELTYHQLLFNFGIIGCLCLVTLFCLYLVSAFINLRHADSFIALRMGVLVGFLSLLIGSYSNPYLQFFDSLIYIMFFVMLTAGKLSIRFRFGLKT